MKQGTLQMGIIIITMVVLSITAMHEEHKLNKRGRPPALSMLDDIPEHDPIQSECAECRKNCRECCEDCNALCSAMGESLKQCMVISMSLLTLDSFRAYLSGPTN